MSDTLTPGELERAVEMIRALPPLPPEPPGRDPELPALDVDEHGPAVPYDPSRPRCVCGRTGTGCSRYVACYCDASGAWGAGRFRPLAGVKPGHPTDGRGTASESRAHRKVASPTTRPHSNAPVAATLRGVRGSSTTSARRAGAKTRRARHQS
jgi:hypothetical protein